MCTFLSQPGKWVRKSYIYMKEQKYTLAVLPQGYFKAPKLYLEIVKRPSGPSGYPKEYHIDLYINDTILIKQGNQEVSYMLEPLV